jgi:glucan exporter ATP-binding protein
MLSSEGCLAASLVAANVAIGVAQLLEPILFGKVVEAISRKLDAMPVVMIWAAVGLFTIAASVVIATQADRLAHRLRLAALANAFEHVTTLPISYHARHGSGAVTRTLIAGTDSLFGIWLTFMREHLVALVTTLCLVPLALSLDKHMSLILGALALIYFGLNIFVSQRTQLGQSTVDRYYNDVFDRVGDVVGNVAVVQSYTRLKGESKALRALMSRLLAVQSPVLTWWAVLMILTRAAGTITMVGVFGVGAWLARNDETTVGEVVTLVGLSILLIQKLDYLAGFISRIVLQSPTLNLFYQLIDAEAEIVERRDAITLDNPKGAIRYEAVTFRYPNTNQGVVDLNFQVEPGQTVALVGPTGAGKTTTLALLHRMNDPTSGRILIDGRDIRDFTLTSLRGAISVVFQDVGLLNRSIAENIWIGRPNASQADVEAAAKLADAHDFILSKAGRYECVIGERGGLLSGGERQRIMIARALLKSAPILILDEATSALDNETEARFKRALDAARSERTTFIIAHRLSTVQNADHILVFENGRIVESGAFPELAAAGGLFSRLVAEGSLRQPTASTEIPSSGPVGASF